MKNLPVFLALLAASGSVASPAVAGRRDPGTNPSTPAAPATKNIVLVHGGLVDGSGWQKVYEILTKDGYHVSIVQNPLTSLDDDVAATKRVLAQQDGPAVLVGHSYGGTVITVAGTDPKVKALVYVAALQPEKGESSADLTTARPPAVPYSLKATSDYFYYFAPGAFAGEVGADLPKGQTDFMAAAQVYTAGACFVTKASAAAWHDKPSYGIVATDDKTLGPGLERFMYQRSGAKVTEVKSSHLVYISHPQAVAAVIEEAARNVK